MCNCTLLTLLPILQTQGPVPHPINWTRGGTPLQVVQGTVEDGQGTVEEGTVEEGMVEEEMVEEETVEEGMVTDGFNNILSMMTFVCWVCV